ncbi:MULTISPECIES: Sec-independent protein translocase protein TatB [Methylotenera]|uniref:Sec-independent protein translocase protein TatB n=1 Tax=Methylotenera TaxID=359407 RepID=UPI00035D9847|nr:MULTISPECIES: Sec-independent protein translocase protein TatB [Methylotenera]
MFGISFSELFVIAIVALLVIGPEKLPKVARTIGALTGRMQRYATQVKEEVNREFRFEELQKLQQEISHAVVSAEQNIHQQVNQVENSIADLGSSKAEPAPNLAQNQAPIQKQTTARKPRAKSTKVISEGSEKVVKAKPVKKTKKVEV